MKHFGEDLYKTVSATLYLTLYTRQSEANDEEIYQPNFDLRVNPEGAFALNQDEEVDLFTLNVGERLAAGNHYILEGPGEKNEDYIELVTDTDVRIQVTLREKEYEIVMEDINGKKDQIIVQKVLTHPRMNILSLVGASSEARPDISIFIDNRTNQMMEISLEGQATENIKVFNEAGYLLSKGETKGLMQLI